MAENYSIREVRKSECGDVLMYATAQGVDLSDAKLKHHLSLIAVDAGKEIAAATLCILDNDNRLNIKVLATEGEDVDELVKEMTDRCLRKVQSETVGSARINSPSAQPAEGILTEANWLDQIEETAPQDEAETDTEAGEPAGANQAA